MFFCCTHRQAAAGLFSRLARWYRHRYRLFGLDRSQRQLVAGLARTGYRNAALVEVGCGVGWLHQWLLAHGARRAVGVDLSPAMLTEARSLARAQGLEDRVRYLEGDFLELAGGIDVADIVLLDKVICCYPDARTLLQQAASKARRAVALTYPRIHPLSRLAHGLFNAFLALLGSGFRTYLHDPRDVEAWLGQAGWVKRHADQTLLWLTQIFVHVNAAADPDG